MMGRRAGLTEKCLNILIRLQMWAVKQTVWKQFLRQTRNPLSTQRRLLRGILRSQASTGFARKYDFASIEDAGEFTARIPIHDYEDLRGPIDRQAACRTLDLNAQQPLAYAQTSGTTGEAKRVPITLNQIAEFKRGQKLFSYAIHRKHPAALTGKILAIVSPAVEGHLSCGAPFGSMSGLVYNSIPRLLRPKYVVPREIFELADHELKYYLIAAFALKQQEISLVATANPSTIRRILDLIADRGTLLVDNIASGKFTNLELDEKLRRFLRHAFAADPARAREIRRIQSEYGSLVCPAIWPKLKAVATWLGGNSSVYIPSLRNQFGDGVRFIDVGYLASEYRGSITADAEDTFSVPTIGENYFEFIPVDDYGKKPWRPIPLHRVEQGEKYYIVVTTANGLYRYFINDIVEIGGLFNKTPTMRFVQKGKGVTNITGEKLYENQLIGAVNQLCRAHPIRLENYMLLADRDDQQYTLVLEANRDLFDLVLAQFESSLCRSNIEFAAKRKSKRLKPLSFIQVSPGAFAAYKDHCVRRGQREGQFKLLRLQYADDISFDFSRYRMAASAAPATESLAAGRQ